MNNKWQKFWQIFLPLILGGAIGFLIQGNMDFNMIKKPPFAPPAILFPIAWTVLYLLIGLSYFLYRRNYEDQLTIKVYYAQLIINLLWPIFFFLLKFRIFSIFWIVLLLGLVGYLIFLYQSQNKVSAYLLIPYFIWILFATYLNIGIVLLN